MQVTHRVLIYNDSCRFVNQVEIHEEVEDFVILLRDQIKKFVTWRINVIGVSPIAWASPRFAFINLVNDFSAPKASSLKNLDLYPEAVVF